MKTELIGKKIYKTSHYGIDSVFGTIERVTPTTAIVRGHRFRLSNFSLIGDSNWSLYGYELENDSLNEKWEKLQLVQHIKAILATYNCEDKFSLESIKTAYALLTTKP